MSEIKERPILFNGAMVRAILGGRKTVTRRAVKPAPQMVTDKSVEPWQGDPVTLLRLLERSGKPCPFGQPGDRLWVRENYGDAGCRLTYQADLDDGAHCMVKRWTPSIHMPRIACRILLEVTGVRVERLQAISYEQAAAEGIHRDQRMWYATDEGGPAFQYPEPAFAQLWRQTGGDWDANPWVWVVEFKRIEQ